MLTIKIIPMLITRKISMFTIRKISILTTRKISLLTAMKFFVLITRKNPIRILCNFLVLTVSEIQVQTVGEVTCWTFEDQRLLLYALICKQDWGTTWHPVQNALKLTGQCVALGTPFYQTRLRYHLTSSAECAEADRTVCGTGHPVLPNKTEVPPDIQCRVRWSWQDSVWHWAPRFAEHMHKNIWSLSPTPFINLRPGHGYAFYWITLPDNTLLSRQCMCANSIKHSVSSEESGCWVTGEKSLFWRAFRKIATNHC